MKKKSKIQGMLIITEHALALDEPGKECHFDLLTVPWDQNAFRKCISYMIQVDQDAVDVQELDPETNPIGVRCWFCPFPESRPLELLHQEHTGRRCVIAGKIIDRLAASTAPFKFPWPKNKPFDDPETLRILEQQLLLRFEIPGKPL